MLVYWPAFTPPLTLLKVGERVTSRMVQKVLFFRNVKACVFSMKCKLKRAARKVHLLEQALFQKGIPGNPILADAHSRHRGQ